MRFFYFYFNGLVECFWCLIECVGIVLFGGVVVVIFKFVFGLFDFEVVWWDIMMVMLFLI